MKTAVMGKVLVAGRVLLGPKKISSGYARIVVLKDGSGCIECFDSKSRIWSPAPDSLRFDEVWAAESVIAPDILARIDASSRQ